MKESMRGSGPEIRLVPMRIAGTYSRGGLKLVPVAPDHRTAWEKGITEEEWTAIRECAMEYDSQVIDSLADKILAAFTQRDAESRDRDRAI